MTCLINEYKIICIYIFFPSCFSKGYQPRNETDGEESFETRRVSRRMFRETLSVLATNVRRMSETLTRNQHSFSFISRSRTFRSIRCYRVQQQGRCNFVNPISFSPTLLPARNLLPYLNNLLIKGIQLSITREKEVMEIIRNNNLLERRF